MSTSLPRSEPFGPDEGGGVSAWAQQNGDRIEPGLRLRPVGGSRVLEGKDGLGRRCRAWILQDDGDRLAADVLTQRAVGGTDDAVRLFVLGEALEDRTTRLLAEIADLVPLRVFRMHPDFAAVGGWRVERVVAGARGELPDAGARDLPPEALRQVHRLEQAARALEPVVRLEGPGWPLLAHGPLGPFAALHRQDGRLWWCTSGQDGVARVEVADDHDGDEVIDRLMRVHWSAPQGPASRLEIQA
ncbi:MAG TPA: hypothetical protein VGC54_05425 [Planctomycetota bacterium]